MRVRNHYFTGELMVFNKIDLVEPEELENRRRVYNAIPASAIYRSTLGTLAHEISQRLADDAVTDS